MFCKNCGKEINDGEKICTGCGQLVNNKTSEDGKVKFLPSFILGLIASLFGIKGGLCMTMCSSIYSSGTEAFICIFGGSILGLIGACQCLSNVKIGSVLQLAAAILMAVCLFGPIGGDMPSIISMVLFIVSGIIGIIYFCIQRKR